MRNALLAALAIAVPSALLLQGCVPFGCGGFEGRDDTVMRTAAGDSLILCGNDGYAVMRANGTILEGRVTFGTEIAGTDGVTGARAFTLVDALDGTMTSTEIGAGWSEVTLDQVELDHAHTQCTDLEAREWFYAGTGYLPIATGFTKPGAELGTVDQVLFCPDGTARIAIAGDAVESASYSTDAGLLRLYGVGTSASTFEGIYELSGTLTVEAVPGGNAEIWTRAATAEMSTALRCGQ
ncbi:MAG: hypothetical protein JWP01_1441 [Myxococcales bacterium]|nr:hypothetical protein [Myxococcales bacterium]